MRSLPGRRPTGRVSACREIVGKVGVHSVTLPPPPARVADVCQQMAGRDRAGPAATATASGERRLRECELPLGSNARWAYFGQFFTGCSGHCLLDDWATVQRRFGQRLPACLRKFCEQTLLRGHRASGPPMEHDVQHRLLDVHFHCSDVRLFRRASD